MKEYSTGITDRRKGQKGVIRRVQRSLPRLLACGWIVCLAVASLQLHRIRLTRQGTAAHAAVHVFAFAVACILLLAASKTRIGKWISAVSLIGLAVVVEVAQSLIYKRVLEWWDVGTDMMGIAIAVVLFKGAAECIRLFRP